MNKVEFSKTKIYSILGIDILKTKEFYTERSYNDLENDTPPIIISEEYASKEFKK